MRQDIDADNLLELKRKHENSKYHTPWKRKGVKGIQKEFKK